MIPQHDGPVWNLIEDTDSNICYQMKKIHLFFRHNNRKETFIYMYNINPNHRRYSKKLELLKPGVLVQEMTDLKLLDPKQC